MKQENISALLPFDKIKTKNIVSNTTGDLILISLEKDATLKEHFSPTDASILILEGAVEFTINGGVHSLLKGDLYNFKMKEMHALHAIENSKILLIK